LLLVLVVLAQLTIQEVLLVAIHRLFQLLLLVVVAAVAVTQVVVSVGMVVQAAVALVVATCTQAVLVHPIKVLMVV
jgi:hypothetical protein